MRSSIIKNPEIHVEFLQNELNDSIGGVTIDIFDFVILCHAGKSQNSHFFDELLKTIYKIQKQHDNDNDNVEETENNNEICM